MPSMPNSSIERVARALRNRKFVLVLLFLVPVGADLLASTVLHAGFWSLFLPNLYYACIVIAGLESGWKAGLIFALLGGLCHGLIARWLLASPFVRLEAQLVAFLVVGFALLETRRRTKSREPSTQEIRVEEWLEQDSAMVQELVQSLNTPFASIEGAAYLLNEDSASPNRRKEFVGIIMKECRRTHAILSELSESAVFVPLSCRPTDASSMLAEIARRATQEYPNPHVSLRVETSSDLAPLWCDRERIEHTIVPFVSDALETVSAGGEILLAADRWNNQARIRLMILGRNVRGRDSAGVPEPHSGFNIDSARIMEARRTVLQHRGTLELDSAGPRRGFLLLTLPLYNRPTA
jgi:signal transduction histidine kinase